eukprot:4362171-Ditylum_brightwellii.AAC.1
MNYTLLNETDFETKLLLGFRPLSTVKMHTMDTQKRYQKYRLDNSASSLCDKSERSNTQIWLMFDEVNESGKGY